MLSPLTAAMLHRQLTELPKLACYAWLDLQPSMERRPSTTHVARLTAPLPLRADVLSLLGPGDYLTAEDPAGDQDGPMPAGAVLAAWCQAITGRHHRADIDSAVETLLRLHPALCALPNAGDYARDISRLHAHLATLGHQPGRRRELTLACPRCTLYSLGQVDGADVRCDTDGCGTTMTRADYDRRAAMFADGMGA